MITKHTCSNGVRIVAEHIPFVRSVAIGIWVKAGSRYEETEMNGISHFLEHMFFKGTTSRNAREIAEAFDAIGGQVNAFTSKEYTCYYAKVLDEKSEYALDILSDMFFNSLFDEEELEKEKNVVLEEINMYEDAPDELVHELLSKASFGGHPLAYSVLGTKETLLRIERKDLERYRDKFYKPENIVISVAGHFSDSLLRSIEKKFGEFHSPSETLEWKQATFCSDKISKNKETEQSHLCVGFLGLPFGHERIYELSILNNVIGGSMSSRLFQEIREEKGLAYSVYSYHSAFSDTGLLTIYAGTAPDQAELVFDTIMHTLQTIKQKGLTKQELENSKAQLKGNLMLSLESTSSRMSRNGKNELLLQKIKSLDEILHAIDSVTLDGVNQLADELLGAPYSLSMISPKSSLLTV